MCIVVLSLEFVFLFFHLYLWNPHGKYQSLYICHLFYKQHLNEIDRGNTSSRLLDVVKINVEDILEFLGHKCVNQITCTHTHIHIHSQVVPPSGNCIERTSLATLADPGSLFFLIYISQVV